MPTTKRGKMFKEIFMTEMKIRDSFKGKTKWPRNDMRQCHSIQKKKAFPFISLGHRNGNHKSNWPHYDAHSKKKEKKS